MMRVIGLGAGGHAKVVIEILRLTGGYELVGLLDPNQRLCGSRVSDVPVLGNDSLLPKLYSQDVRHAFIGVGGTRDTKPRRTLYESVLHEGFELVDAIHPNSVVSHSARLGIGPTVMAGAVVNADATLGDNVIVNSTAIVEHDCVIEDHVHIATGAKLGGNVRVGAGAHIGLGASVRQSITIGADAVVGAGAVVVKDVPQGVLVVGVPARPVERVEA